jgi:hypothetical protein
MARETISSGSIQIEGLGLLQKQLKALEADKADLVEANLNAAETLIKAARPLVPVRTGALLNSLKASKAQGYAQANAGSPKRVPYANPIHWGWSVVSAKQPNLKPGTYRNIKPQPFFAKALGYTYQELIANYERDLQKMIDKYGLGE